jgi:pilus assembly protein CpaB
MRARAVFMLGLAILFGVISIILVRQWMASQVTAPAPAVAEQTKSVVVAQVPLKFGDRVTNANLREAQWPVAIVPASTFEHIADLTAGGESRVVLYPIAAGEPVLESKVTGVGGRATLSTVIDKDMRAYTISVNEVSGAAGFILPNDRVDILLTRHPEGQPDPITDVLLQNIKVLAINQLANQKTDQPVVGHAVTIEVTQEQAQKLTLAATVGSLTLVLRNESNSTATDARTVSVKDLRVGEANTPAPPAAAPAPAPTPVVVERTPAPKVDPMTRVEVFRGVQSSVVEVSRDAGGPTARARPSSARTAAGSSSGGS